MQTAQDIITTYGRTGARLREVFFQERTPLLQKAALHMARCLIHDGKVLVLSEGAAGICARAAAQALLDRLDLDRRCRPSCCRPGARGTRRRTERPCGSSRLWPGPGMRS